MQQYTSPQKSSTLTSPAQCFSSFQGYDNQRKYSTKADHSRRNDRICPDFDAFKGRPRPNPSFNCINQLRRRSPCSPLLSKSPPMLSGGRAMGSGTHGRLGPMNFGCALQTVGEQDDAHRKRQRQKRPSVSHDHPRSPIALYS